MSAGVAGRRRRSRFIYVLWLVGALAALHLISRVTGFGDWLNGTPTAIGVVRAIAVLFFGAGTFALLFLRDQEDGPRGLRDWLFAAFACAMTIINAVLLIGGEDAI